MEIPVKKSSHSSSQKNLEINESSCLTLLIQDIQQIIQQLELLENTLAECWIKETTAKSNSSFAEIKPVTES
jgi:DNA-binding winged helix-turn-helix (wHTH) protein